MKSRKPVKELVLLFTATLVVYLAAYFFIEHQRHKKSAWVVTFIREATGTPALIVNQPTLAITNVAIAFSGAELTNAFQTETISLGKPKPVPYATPFGECIFMDTTFQPGTVVFKAFGHEIQLIPRVLTIDGQEHPWKPNDRILLTATNSLSVGTNNAR